MTAFPAYVVAESAAFALAIARVGGFFLTSPFPGRNVPSQIKIGLVLLLAFVARAATPARAELGLDVALLGMVPAELGIGLVIGFTVRVTFATAEVLGSSLAQSTGLTMGAVFDPTLGTEDPLPSRIVSLLAMLIFVAVGAHRVALAYMLASFGAIPIGHAVAIGAAAPAFVDMLAQAMEIGVRLSLPAIAVGLGIQIALALVSRASPSLQIFSVGMGITVAAGMLALFGSLPDIASGITAAIAEESPRLERVLADVRP